MILVTGAGGTVGGATAARLAAGGEAVRCMSRRPGCALPDGRAEAVVGDFDDPHSLLRALEGVRAVLAVTSDPLSPWQDGNLVDAARRAGVGRVVKLSLLSVADPGARDLVTEWQRAAEDRVRASGLEWTILRPRAFMSNTLAWAGAVRAGEPVRTWPADAPTTPVDPHDLAEVAAAALTGTGHAGRTYALTGPQVLTARQQAAELSRVLGRPVGLREHTPAQARAAMAGRLPAAVADAMIERGHRQRQGTKAQVHPELPRLLGRPATSYGSWVRAHAAAFGVPVAGAGKADVWETYPQEAGAAPRGR